MSQTEYPDIKNMDIECPDFDKNMDIIAYVYASISEIVSFNISTFSPDIKASGYQSLCISKPPDIESQNFVLQNPDIQKL